MLIATTGASIKTAGTGWIIAVMAAVQADSGRQAVTVIEAISIPDTLTRTARVLHTTSVAVPDTATTTSVPSDVSTAATIVVTTIMDAVTNTTTTNAVTAQDPKRTISKMKTRTPAPAAAL